MGESVAGPQEYENDDDDDDGDDYCREEEEEFEIKSSESITTWSLARSTMSEIPSLKLTPLGWVVFD